MTSICICGGLPRVDSGGVKIAATLPENVTQAGALEYYAGQQGGEPTWVSDELAAALLVEPTVGEMSIMYNQAARRWTMLYFNHTAEAIELREAPQPWGPWSDPLQVLSAIQQPGLYGSYMNPLYVENDGETIYFTMSLWGPYDVYLAKATLQLAAGLPGDFDGDGDVDGQDFLDWQRDPEVGSLEDWQTGYGTSTPFAASGTIVPEPATVMLLVAAAGWGLGRRR